MPGWALWPNADPGFPGYAGELPHNQSTLAEMLKANGYATMAVGKWHLCLESDLSVAGDTHSWPLQRGFDQYYGFLEALTDFHFPHQLYEGNNPVHIDEYPEGYYLTDDLTDRACRMIREVKTADPDKPLFLYYAHGAVHAPLHAKAEDTARHRGNYDKGWDQLREERLARQKEMGHRPVRRRAAAPATPSPTRTWPPGTATPSPTAGSWPATWRCTRPWWSRSTRAWPASPLSWRPSASSTTPSSFSPATTGRLGKAEAQGSTSYFTHSGTGARPSPPVSEFEIEAFEADEIGGPTTWPHYPRGWAMACNTPFRLYKITAHRGGHSVPMVLSWPARTAAIGGQLRHQYTHITDLLPTLADLLGLDVPTERHGQVSDAPDGVSFAASLDDADAPSDHTEQYIECIGHRGMYRDGWAAAIFHEHHTPFSEDRWELFNLADDFNERNNLADAEPEKLAEMVEAWEEAAWRNRVFPLDEASGLFPHVGSPPSTPSSPESCAFCPDRPPWSDCGRLDSSPAATSPSPSTCTTAPATKACWWPTAAKRRAMCSTSKTMPCVSWSTVPGGIWPPTP